MKINHFRLSMLHAQFAIVLGIVLTLAVGCNDKVQSKYIDHRFSNVDSLEQVLATNPPTGAELGNIYYFLMWSYQYTDIEKSMEYARKCITTSIPYDEWKHVSYSFMMLGNGLYRISQFDSALVYFGKALEATERMRDFPKKFFKKDDVEGNLSAILGNMANLYKNQGKIHEAMEYYNKAMELFEKYDYKEMKAHTYFNFGEMYMMMENYPQAEINFMKLDSIAVVMNDSMFIADAKWQFANLYFHKQNYAQALQNAEIAYDYYFSHPEEEEYMLKTLNLLSQIYLEGYDDDLRAEEYARQALTLSNKLDIPYDKAVSLCMLSGINMKREQWRRAEQTALEALATDDSEPKNTLALYEILAKAYGKLGNSDKAWEYLDKLKELQSTWSNKNYQSSIREMEVKYETEKKELKIASLEERQRFITLLFISSGVVFVLALAALFFLWRFTVQKRQLAETRIVQLEKEKQLIATQSVLDGEIQERIRLARDLHDGLGSMLTGIKLHLQEMKKSMKIEFSEVERYDKAMDMIDDSMREMRRVSHNLMPDTLSRFGLKSAVDDFCRSLPSPVVFDFYGAETRLEPKLEVFIYRSIHELVNNALKYSDASQIMVQIMQEPDRIALTVQDDGCGFDPQAETKGTGLKNIRTRVTSFGGNLVIDSKANKGTEINVELKIEN